MKKSNIKTHLDTDKKNEKKSNIFFYFLLILMVVASLVGYMYVRNGIDALTTRNLAMKSNNIKLEQEIKFLQSEVNDLSRPGQIRSIAGEQLGLVNSAPQPDAIFVKKK
jgi:cell division protein FtsL